MNGFLEAALTLTIQKHIKHMNSMTQINFSYISPLGISVILFIFCGVFRLIIGSLTPMMINTKMDVGGIIMSHRTDKILFKEEPFTLLQKDETLARTRSLILILLAGMLVTAGVLTTSIAWFGLKEGEWWALLTLAGASIVEIPFWYLFFRFYFNAGITLTLADIPPFIWVPALLYIPAIILGWIGLK